MGTRHEKRFDYSKGVPELKRFIKGKRQQLQEDITCMTISVNSIKKAQKYIGIIDSVLSSEYLLGEKLGLKVFELVELLKTEDLSLKKQIEAAQRKLKLMNYFMNASVEELMATEEFGIPDEFGIHRASVISMKRELSYKIDALETDIESCKIRLRQCRDLKGMINKPNTFYATVYK